jgi:hypothetical protein
MLFPVVSRMFSYVNSLFFFHKGREYVNIDEYTRVRIEPDLVDLELGV